MGFLNSDSGILLTEGQQHVLSKTASGVVTQNLTQPYKSAAERQFKIGVSIPNFNARKKRGELLPHTAFGQTRWKAKFDGGTYNHRVTSTGATTSITNFKGVAMPNKYRVEDFENFDCDPTTSPGPIPDYLIQKAAARIYSQGFDASTALAELGKSVSMFKGIARRMVELARRYNTKRMHKLWLEGRYGYRTLAFDIRDLHSALTEFDGGRKLWSERAGSSHTVSSTIVTTLTGGPGAQFNFVLTSDYKHVFSIRGAVSALIEPSRFTFNPLVTGWELYPLSFVLDWVLDVGTALEALSFSALSSQWAASTGYQCTTTVSHNLVGTPVTGTTGSASAKWTHEGLAQSRTPATSINLKPQLTNRLPTWDLLMDLRALSELRGRKR